MDTVTGILPAVDDLPSPSMDPRRALPSVDRVLAALDGLPHDLLADAARGAVDDARACVADGGEPPTEDAVIAAAAARAAEVRTRLLQPVVNATGVLLHTNLGRAPIGDEALAAVAAVARGASNLELRLATGGRGSRHEHAGALLARAVGAEAGLVVNNNAAAVLLTLGALARDRRGDRVARRARGDRRRLPRPRHHGGVPVPARRGRHHQPHPPGRLRGRCHHRHRAAAQGPRIQLPDGRLHRSDARRRARDARSAGDGRRRLRSPRRDDPLAPEPSGRGCATNPASVSASTPAPRW